MQGGTLLPRDLTGLFGQIESARNSLVAVAEGTFVLLAHDWLRSGQSLLPELTLRQVEAMPRGHTPQSDSEVAL
jgi:hypothetical protein